MGGYFMQKEHRPSTGRKILISVASFFLSLTFVFLTVIVVSDVTLFNDRDLLSRVSETTYFSELNNEITLRCKTIAAKSGVDYDAISSVITSSRIDSDSTVYFNSMKSEDPDAGHKTIDELSLKTELYESIVASDPDITDSEKVSAEIIAAKIAAEYKRIMILENFENFIEFSGNYKSVSNYVFLILAVLMVYLIYVIISLNRRSQKHRLLCRFAVVGGSTGLTVLALSAVMKFSGVIEKINFASSLREYNLFVSFFTDFINSTLIVGVCWVAVCIVLLVLWYKSVSGRVKR